MNINRENIDQHLFDYFEEQLSPKDADVLMNFIHQNPEFERDFVQWKKAYHHKDHIKEDYDIASKIKSSIRVNKGFKPLYLGGILVVGFALGWIVNGISMTTNANTRDTVFQMTHKNDIEEKSIDNNTAAGKNAFDYSSHKNNRQALISDKLKGVGNVTNVQRESIIDPEENPIMGLNESKSMEEKAIDTELHITQKDHDFKVVEKDSSVQIQEIETQNQKKGEPQKQKKKYKGKRKGIFSTTDKILPVNTNF